MRFIQKFNNCITNFWEIAIRKHVVYEYIIEDIELEEKNGNLSALIYYRAIGARSIEYGTASELNKSDVFAKFMPTQAQAIVTLATIEAMITMAGDTLASNYRSYVKKCAIIFRSQRGK